MYEPLLQNLRRRFTKKAEPCPATNVDGAHVVHGLALAKPLNVPSSPSPQRRSGSVEPSSSTNWLEPHELAGAVPQSRPGAGARCRWP